MGSWKQLWQCPLGDHAPLAARTVLDRVSSFLLRASSSLLLAVVVLPLFLALVACYHTVRSETDDYICLLLELSSGSSTAMASPKWH